MVAAFDYAAFGKSIFFAHGSDNTVTLAIVGCLQGVLQFAKVRTVGALQRAAATSVDLSKTGLHLAVRTEKAQWGIVRNDYTPLPIYEALRGMQK